MEASRRAATRSVSERVPGVSFSSNEAVTVASPVSVVAESLIHDGSSPTMEICHPQLAWMSNENDVANDGARMACILNEMDSRGSSTSSLQAPVARSSVRAADHRKNRFKRFFFIFVYFLRSTNTGR